LECGEDERRRRAEENWIDWEYGDERRRAEEKEAKLSCLFRGNAAMALPQSYRQRATSVLGEPLRRRRPLLYALGRTTYSISRGVHGQQQRNMRNTCAVS
jgi:hypothetical protein